jgi:hypothetical protein
VSIVINVIHKRIERPGNGGSESGAALIEFALVAFLFISVVLTFLDLANYLFVQALLSKGAQEALMIAEKTDGFGIDTAMLDPAGADYAAQVSEYNAARNLVAAKASELALSVIAEVGSTHPNAAVRLREFTPLDQYPTGIVDGPAAPTLVLRPGDSGKDEYGNTIHHLSRCSASISGCPAAKQRNSSDTMERMLRDFPIVVRVEADITTYSPFLPRLVAQGIAVGWREQPVRSGFSTGTFAPSDIDTAIPAPDDGGGGDSTCVPRTCTGASHWDGDLCECISDTGN